MGQDRNLKRKLRTEFEGSHSSRKIEESIGGTSRIRSVRDGKQTVYTHINETARSKNLEPTIPPLAPLPLQSEAVQSTSKENLDESGDDIGDDETQVCPLFSVSYSLLTLLIFLL